MYHECEPNVKHKEETASCEVTFAMWQQSSISHQWSTIRVTFSGTIKKPNRMKEINNVAVSLCSTLNEEQMGGDGHGVKTNRWIRRKQTTTTTTTKKKSENKNVIIKKNKSKKYKMFSPYVYNELHTRGLQIQENKANLLICIETVEVLWSMDCL